MSDYNTNQKELFYVFLDLRKSFDSVSHQAMPVAYRRAKISELGISHLNELYRCNSTQLSSDESNSRYAITRGALQGDPLSPILFNLVLDEACAVLKEYYGARLNGVRLNRLLFADDAVLFGETLFGLQINCGPFQRRLAAYGLKFNASNCAAAHLRCGGKRKRWFVALKIVGVRDINTLN